MEHTSRNPEPGDVYAYYIDELSRYGTCQILSVHQECQSLCYVTLDYLAEIPPTAEQLDSIKPYYRQAFRCRHSITKSCIYNTPVPRNYIYIGQCELKTDTKCNSFSGNWPKGSEYYLKSAGGPAMKLPELLTKNIATAEIWSEYTDKCSVKTAAVWMSRFTNALRKLIPWKHFPASPKPK